MSSRAALKAELAALKTRLAALESLVGTLPSRTEQIGAKASYVRTVIRSDNHGRSIGDIVDSSGHEATDGRLAVGTVCRIISNDLLEVAIAGQCGKPGIATGATLMLGDAWAGVHEFGTAMNDDTIILTGKVFYPGLSNNTGTVFRITSEVPLAIPMAVRLNNPGWSPSMADTVENAVVHGIVTLVDDEFYVGYSSGTMIIRGVPEGSQLLAGGRFYLSDTTAGSVTNIKPEIAVPLFDVIGVFAHTPGQYDVHVHILPSLSTSAETGSAITTLPFGGTGRDFTTVATNAIVFKNDATTLGGTINPGGPGVLTQASSGIPYFLPSTADNTLLRRSSSGALEWGKVDPNNDLSGPVPQSNGGLGNDVSAVSINAVWYKAGANASGGTFNSGLTLGALVQASGGVPYFLNFDAGNTMDVSGGSIKSAICTRISNYETPPTHKMDLLKYNTGSVKWEPFKLITTKGDLCVTDGLEYMRLPVGSNDQVLIADSTQTVGLRWGAVSGLPAVTASDEGRMLYVDSSGAWSNSRDVYLGDNPLTASSVQGSFGVVVSSDGDYIKISSGGIEFFDRSVSTTTALIKIAIGHASLNATGRALAVRELDVCDSSGNAKKALFLCSDPY